MNRYRLKLGERGNIVTLYFTICAETRADAVRLAREQLYEQMKATEDDLTGRIRFELDWGLYDAGVYVDTTLITEDCIISEVLIPEYEKPKKQYELNELAPFLTAETHEILQRVL